MRSSFLKVGLASLLVALASGQGTPARADLVLGFTDGLNGWTVTDSSLVSVDANNVATIHESSRAGEVDLSFLVTIPTGAQTLQFTLDSTTPNSDTTANPPAAFGASLVNPNLSDPNTESGLAPLVQTVDPYTDSYYAQDLTGPLGSPLTVTVNVSSLAGQDAEVIFRLIGANSTIANDSSVSLSNVRITDSGSGGIPTPEPSTLTLGLVGVACWVGHRIHRHRRSA